MDALGATSQWIAAARAKEGLRSDRLFFDPYASALAGTEGARLLSDLDQAGSVSTYLAIRTRFFDDFALEVANFLHQIVILAAGMDARAFRLSWPPGTTIFELDRQEVLSHKERILRERAAMPRCDRRVVCVDLKEPWQGLLRAGGFDARAPALFLAEGLTPYLSRDQVMSLFAELRDTAPVGSHLGVDFAGQAFLDSPSTRPYLSRLRSYGIPWQFGTDEPGQLLARFGWNATVTLPGEPNANWGRWPTSPVSRRGSDFPRSYLVRAALRCNRRNTLPREEQTPFR
jgi:methyltransferase (TIGR00027 family)